MRWWPAALFVLCGCDKLFSVDVVDYTPPNDAADAPTPDAATPLLGKWMTATSLPAGRDYNHSHAALVGDTLYLIGGFASGEQDVVYQATLNQGALGSWTMTSPLPAPRAVGDVVTIGNRIYVVGGANGGGAQSSVYVGEASSTGGIPSWSPASPLPEPRKAHAAATANGYLYAFGGGDTLNGRQTSVFYAPIRGDGSLGLWQATEPLPAPRANFGGVAARGYLYAIGGDEGEVVNHATVYFAALDPDTGAVGAWTATTSLPSARRSHVAVTDSFYIYVIGGWTTAATSEVLYSRIGDDGTLGAWDSNEPLLTARHRHAAVLADGHVFVLGGAEAPTSVEHSAQGAF